MTDLSPDVRDRAARRAQSTWLTRPSDGWRAVVDAVVAVVAPEIERPLQARIEELEAANAAVEEENDLLRDVIQQKHARVELLTAALTGLVGAVSDPAVMCFGTEITRARAALAAGETESEAS